MYPPKFDYLRADSAANALELLAANPDAKVMAGGHSLIPAMNLRLADPGTIIDIGRVADFKFLSANDGYVGIGSGTTHAEVAASSDVPSALSEAAGLIGDPQVRNRGTVGGNIAHADPASDLPTVLVALDATISTVSGSGTRMIKAGDFFVDLFETALNDGELVAEISMNQDGANTGSAYAKLSNPASRYAMVGAAARVTVEGGVFTAVSVAVGGLTPKAQAAPSVGAALVGQAATADNIAAAAAAVQNDLGDDVMGDIHASADYRRQMATVFVKRALTKATERAG
ncbi:MAG: xanthine dehydrogenase family protein subunit M [Ardenticatenaceae bacterium]|nr:xanthine dehydrogenase family protein subunit M [Ardenticatenaceae bacterium]